jgi:hypothetical protein
MTPCFSLHCHDTSVAKRLTADLRTGVRFPPPGPHRLWSLSGLLSDGYRGGSVQTVRFSWRKSILYPLNRSLILRQVLAKEKLHQTIQPLASEIKLVTNYIFQSIPVKLIIAQLIRDIPAFYGTRKFIALVVRATTGPYPETDKTSLHFHTVIPSGLFLILSSHIRSSLLNCFFC